MAGPRDKIYLRPSKLKCGIVTCGGLCPGLKMSHPRHCPSVYQPLRGRTIFGFRFGFEAHLPPRTHPFELSPVTWKISTVRWIHSGILPGPQEVSEMVDTWRG